ncbi:hypothetical protein DXG03_009734 [Asterophora parasitica]|uniref:DUF6589 domain-containing protein n=1 Tax=Asterophora parasitica TaxID=117018 RepID=A0A9P7FZM7_9AGAR|nr:hypothetical protein DXG03_009734 [Asterophora parasitica]
MCQILQRMYRPPRGRKDGKGGRPAGARRVLREFATTCIIDCVDREMKNSSSLFLSPPEALHEDHLTNVDFTEMITNVKQAAPILWRVLHRAAYTPQQELVNTLKDPDMVSFMLLSFTVSASLTRCIQGTLSRISQCQYSRSPQRGRLAKLWAIYLKACGLSARAFDTIHYLGLTMSHKWTANAIRHLSDRAMDAARLAISRNPWNISHDNVNIPLRVFSRRLHNQSHSAATVWILPPIATLAPDANRRLQLHRAEHADTVFDYKDVLYGNHDALTRLDASYAHHVLTTLTGSPEFENYAYLDSLLFAPPPPVDKIPGGPQNTTKQFILGTCDIEEASYDGTLKVMAEFFRQLELDSDEEQRRTGTERVIVSMGDQLTVERLRGLWRYRHEDHNSFDRLDYMIPIFGWFHLWDICVRIT